MAAPTNHEELYQVLKAFSETDCNGNGYHDEIPLFGSQNAGVGAHILDWIINMFVYYDRNCPYIVDENNKLVLTEDEKEETEMERTNTSHRISTARTEFCAGTMDPNDDSAWNGYLTELNGLGLSSVVAQDQLAYDRQ